MDPDNATGKLGILAGSGVLPGLLRTARQGVGGEVFILAFTGITDPETVEGAEHLWVGLGKVGATIRGLKNAGCEAVVMAGSIERPSWSALAPDLRGAALVQKLLKAKGDDAILKGMVSELEGEGFRVLGPDDILADLLARAGTLGEKQPSEADWLDIRAAAAAALAVGRDDTGQAAIARSGEVLGVEGADGTDALVERCHTADKSGGVLVKLPKPGQERRADLPAIGLHTVEAVAAVGLNGIAVEAGGSLILGKAEVVAAADRLGVFVYGATQREWGPER